MLWNAWSFGIRQRPLVIRDNPAVSCEEYVIHRTICLWVLRLNTLANLNPIFGLQSHSSDRIASHGGVNDTFWLWPHYYSWQLFAWSTSLCERRKPMAANPGRRRRFLDKIKVPWMLIELVWLCSVGISIALALILDSKYNCQTCRFAEPQWKSGTSG